MQRAWREQFENPVPLYKQLAQVAELPSLQAKLAANIDRLKLIDRAKFDEWESQRVELENELKKWEFHESETQRSGARGIGAYCSGR